MRNEAGKEIDWESELGPEMYGFRYQYKLPRNPEVVGRMATAAVYKLLTDVGVSDQSRANFLEGNGMIQTEDEERLANIYLDRHDQIFDSHGLEEFDEAARQGNRARKATEEGLDHTITAGYDIWNRRQIHERINISPDGDEKDIVTMDTTLAEVAAVKGKPGVILSRQIDAPELKESGQNILTFLGKIADKLGIKSSDVIQSMLDGEQSILFIKALNEAGHDEPDTIRRTLANAISGLAPQPPAEDQYELLSPAERLIAQRPRKERMKTKIKKPLKQGNTEAELDLNIWANGNISYNPSSKKIEGEITLDDDAVVYARVYPKITSRTTDEELLEIRREASEIADELGFPKP